MAMISELIAAAEYSEWRVVHFQKVYSADQNKFNSDILNEWTTREITLRKLVKYEIDNIIKRSL
jgi:hypothetical protein